MASETFQGIVHDAWTRARGTVIIVPGMMVCIYMQRHRDRSYQRRHGVWSSVGPTSRYKEMDLIGPLQVGALITTFGGGADQAFFSAAATGMLSNMIAVQESLLYPKACWSLPKVALNNHFGHVG